MDGMYNVVRIVIYVPVLEPYIGRHATYIVSNLHNVRKEKW